MRVRVGNWRPFVIVFLALAALPATARAQTTFTASAGMPVRIEIVGQCFVSASDLAFGAYVSNSTVPANGQTTIQLQCSPGIVAELGLDAGATPPSGTTSRRSMFQESGTDRLGYDLFQDSGRTMHWGDRSGVDTLEVTATGAPQTIPVYGQIPAAQRVRDGNYSDTITIRVLF
jgi:spore coat protein U-like protein